MNKLVSRIHFEAEENDQALEVLGILAYTHLPSRKLLGELSTDGNEKAKELLDKVDQKAQEVREEYGDRIYLHQWDTRKESTTMGDERASIELVEDAWNWFKEKWGKKEDPK